MQHLSKFAKFGASIKNAMTSRDAATTLENLKTINAGVAKLQEIISAYTGGLLSASGISNQEAQVGQDIKNATADTKASEVVGEEEAKEIIAYIENTLLPTISSQMVALKSKKELLAASNLQGTTLNDLKELRELTNTLSVEMAAKAPASLQEESRRVQGLVDAQFAEAVEVYSA